MLDALRAHFKVSWIETIGTDPRYPPTEAWPRLVDELIESITEPVYGVGHSLGGYLNYLAAVRRPAAQGVRRASLPLRASARGGYVDRPGAGRARSFSSIILMLISTPSRFGFTSRARRK